MGVRGKLIASVEVRCGGHAIHDIIHNNTHHIPKITPRVINHFEIHESETIQVGSVVSWKYIQSNTHFLKRLDYFGCLKLL